MSANNKQLGEWLLLTLRNAVVSQLLAVAICVLMKKSQFSKGHLAYVSQVVAGSTDELNTDEPECLKDTVAWHQLKMNQSLDSHCQYLLRVGVFVRVTAIFVEGRKCFSM